MATPSLIERVVGSLFGGSRGEDAKIGRQLVDDMIEMVVETVEPRVRQVSRYNQKLQDSMRATITHLRRLGSTPLEPLLLERGSWAADPRLNAFFATAGDVPATIGRSRELRAFFENPLVADAREAYAILGMRKNERTIFAPALEGESLRHDVAQVSVSFSDHRIVAPRRTETEARLETGIRIIRRMAQVALSRIIALDERATELKQRKAYLAARLRLLTLSRDGAGGMFEATDSAAEIEKVERELKETVDDYIEAKGGIATIEDQLERIAEVFGRPGEHVMLGVLPLRVSRTGIKLDVNAVEPANEITLAELVIAENLHAVIAIVRCPRAELPPKEDLLANAARHL
ncbi:MAG: hypothetical protein IT529_16795 [Burkholderiales bacterium]|nr:hypothetical protein [Burkholderiales bacterium]